MTESIVWRRLDLPGHEIARLESLGDGWRLSGTTSFEAAQGLSRLDYLVICDAAWQTISARVTGVTGNRAIDLNVSVDVNRRWRLNGFECAAVERCVDIDLGFSPSTNLLPIRRLKLGFGEEAVVRAAWLPFPSLSFELLPQVYRREGERTYRYEVGGGIFVRTLEVNAAGFVTSYPGLWQAESVG
jgi:hypothetical protein